MTDFEVLLELLPLSLACIFLKKGLLKTEFPHAFQNIFVETRSSSGDSFFRVHKTFCNAFGESIFGESAPFKGFCPPLTLDTHLLRARRKTFHFLARQFDKKACKCVLGTHT